jgi:hypothetical protein
MQQQAGIPAHKPNYEKDFFITIIIAGRFSRSKFCAILH